MIHDSYAALLDAVRGVHWPTRRRARAPLPGEHQSRMRGRSSEFSEYRLYRQGDDPRRIDWKLFARTDRAYIRLATEPIILPTTLIVDASASMAFPEKSLDKWELARQIALGLGAVANGDGDPVGLVISHGNSFSEMGLRGRRGVVREMLRLLRETAPGGAAPLAPAVGVAARRSSRMVVITDFLGDADALLAMMRPFLAAGREVYAIHIVADEELNPSLQTALVADPESPDLRRPFTGDLRDLYEARFTAWRGELATAWRIAGAHYAMAVTNREPVNRLIRRIVAAGATRTPVNTASNQSA